MSVRVYCVCNSSSTAGFMIQCDKCNEWFHGKCIDLTPEEADEIDVYVCEDCENLAQLTQSERAKHFYKEIGKLASASSSRGTGKKKEIQVKQLLAKLNSDAPGKPFASHEVEALLSAFQQQRKLVMRKGGVVVLKS